MKYRKKPVVIDAYQLGGDEPDPMWLVDAMLDGIVTAVNGKVYIKTLEGLCHASNGDYIIRGVKGEIYPCKPDIFKMTYEEVV